MGVDFCLRQFYEPNVNATIKHMLRLSAVADRTLLLLFLIQQDAFRL